MKSLANIAFFLLTYVSVHALAKSLANNEYVGADFTAQKLTDMVKLSDGL